MKDEDKLVAIMEEMDKETARMVGQVPAHLQPVTMVLKELLLAIMEKQVEMMRMMSKADDIAASLIVAQLADTLEMATERTLITMTALATLQGKEGK
jgi:hypothetical protein